MKKLLLTLLFAGLTVNAAASHAATAVLAGGCFWCMESDFEKLHGVSDVVSGFTGGTHPDPTYGGDHSGHYEAVEITYDPAIVDYQGILHTRSFLGQPRSLRCARAVLRQGA